MRTTKKWYVVTTDTFLSGWGHANGLTNKLIFLCDSEGEAQIVADNANNRTDQTSVDFGSVPPSYFIEGEETDYEHGPYYVQIKTAEDYPRWYEKDYFKNRKL